MSDAENPVVLDVFEHPITGELHNRGTHGVHFVTAGGKVVKLLPGDKYQPDPDGGPGLILRRDQ